MFKTWSDSLKLFVRKLSLTLMVCCFLLALLLPQPYNGEKPGVFLNKDGKINITALILFEILMITLSFTFLLIADATKVITYGMVKSTINTWKTEQKLSKIHSILHPLPSFIKDVEHLEQEELRLKQSEVLQNLNTIWTNEKQNYEDTIIQLENEIKMLKNLKEQKQEDNVKKIKVKEEQKIELRDEDYDAIFK